MKKEELKNIIKPLIKECLKEVLIEEGLTKMLAESIERKEKEQPKVLQQLKNEAVQQTKQSLVEAKKKMLEAIGNSGFDAFSGTEPITEGGTVSQSSVPVTGFNSSDPGVDISRLMSGKLKATFNALNGKKAK